MMLLTELRHELTRLMEPFRISSEVTNYVLDTPLDNTACSTTLPVTPQLHEEMKLEELLRQYQPVAHVIGDQEASEER